LGFGAIPEKPGPKVIWVGQIGFPTLWPERENLIIPNWDSPGIFPGARVLGPGAKKKFHGRIVGLAKAWWPGIDLGKQV